jgi:hypothetical protein
MSMSCVVHAVTIHVELVPNAVLERNCDETVRRIWCEDVDTISLNFVASCHGWWERDTVPTMGRSRFQFYLTAAYGRRFVILW